MEEMEFVFGLCTFPHFTLGQAVFGQKQYWFQRSHIYSTHLIYSREVFVFLKLRFSLQALEFELLKIYWEQNDESVERLYEKLQACREERHVTI